MLLTRPRERKFPESNVRTSRKLYGKGLVQFSPPAAKSIVVYFLYTQSRSGMERRLSDSEKSRRFRCGVIIAQGCRPLVHVKKCRDTIRRTTDFKGIR